LKKKTADAVAAAAPAPAGEKKKKTVAATAYEAAAAAAGAAAEGEKAAGIAATVDHAAAVVRARKNLIKYTQNLKEVNEAARDAMNIAQIRYIDAVNEVYHAEQRFLHAHEPQINAKRHRAEGGAGDVAVMQHAYEFTAECRERTDSNPFTGWLLDDNAASKKSRIKIHWGQPQRRQRNEGEDADRWMTRVRSVRRRGRTCVCVFAAHDDHDHHDDGRRRRRVVSI
jgi:hypothetical protein